MSGWKYSNDFLGKGVWLINEVEKTFELSTDNLIFKKHFEVRIVLIWTLLNTKETNFE